MVREMNSRGEIRPVSQKNCNNNIGEKIEFLGKYRKFFEFHQKVGQKHTFLVELYFIMKNARSNLTNRSSRRYGQFFEFRQKISRKHQVSYRIIDLVSNYFSRLGRRTSNFGNSISQHDKISHKLSDWTIIERTKCG